MPVNVPDEPKRYTTVYDNFKGVDFTDDASNVYKRRSPTGLNMLPDLDGRPYKRTGWKVRFDVQDFANAAGLVGVREVIPKRTHYFTYDGHDFLMIFNSLGVFWIKDDDTSLSLAELYDEDAGTSGAFPPFVTIDSQQVQLEADANRAFFFEGGGTSGFYAFVGNDLYRFGENENGDYYFMAVEPYVPTVITGAQPSNHVGTALDSLNLLTDKRTIEYFGDGTTDYALPNLVDSEDDISVQILSEISGEWENIPRNSQDYPWSLDNNVTVKFTQGKEPPASTVGNVRITYTPEGGTSVTILSAETRKITCKRKFQRGWIRYRRAVVNEKYNSSKKKWVVVSTVYEDTTDWELIIEGNDLTSEILEVNDIYRQSDFVLMSDHTGEFASTDSFDLKWGAYNSYVEITPKEEIFSEASDSKKTTTETIEAWQRDGVYWAQATTESRKTVYIEHQYKNAYTTLAFEVYGTYQRIKTSYADVSVQSARDAFATCKKALTFGNNIYNQVFLASNNAKDYKNRVWYCAANNPAYFPDLNYMEVGADDNEVMGLEKVGSYLGIVKKGRGSGASVYLAYPTSFEEETTYAVKQSVNGIGAISNGAFNILNEEPLFLSEKGVAGIDISETDVNKQIRNRSFYINKRLTAEPHLENAISFVHKGLYYLAINNHCYVLDGAQKSSWANEKTNLQYECYYLDNIPAQCFAKMGETLYFTDFGGRLCCFRDKKEQLVYVDDYVATGEKWTSTTPIVDKTVDITYLAGTSGENDYILDIDNNRLTDENSNRFLVLSGYAEEGDTVRYGENSYTILDIVDGIASLADGVPISAEWSTIADDDEAVHFYKNLTKKGFVISLLPEHGNEVVVVLRPDERDPVEIGRLPAGTSELPWDLIVRKKVKKYKRLQIICRNSRYNDGFSLDQIIKTYTMGNYSKNRR